MASTSMTTLVQTKPPRRGSRPTPAGPSSSPTTSTLRLLTFNIGAAAAPRAETILRWLKSRSDDVIVLTETSSGAGTTLLAEGLRAVGWHVCHCTQPRERGVLVASRIPIADNLSDQLGVTLPCRAVAVVLDTRPQRLALAGIYIPSRDRSEEKVARKQAFIHSLLAAVRGLSPAQRDRLVIAGDYNAIARAHEPRLSGFFPWEYGLHESLETMGLRPAHELLRMTSQPHSWIGRTGLRYLYDYIHVGRGLHRAVEQCEYLHGPRERRLSDHAAVAARVRVA